MKNNKIITYTKDFVDSNYTVDNKICDDDFTSISKVFLKNVQRDFPNNSDFEKLLIAVYIPDLYMENGSKEKLFTKLVEVLVAEWGRRMGFQYEIITKNSGVEDVRLFIKDKAILIDSKTFRLGRSQKAPNVKDFLKLESVSYWIENCRNEGHEVLGAMVVYTNLHEWITMSESYEQCSVKSTPTIMLPYNYLAYLLNKKNNYDTTNLAQLWDYDRIFPEKLPERDNKKLYWKQINKEIYRITNTNKDELDKYMTEIINPFTRMCVLYQKQFLENIIKETKCSIKRSIENLDPNVLVEDYTTYRTNVETKEIIKTLNYIDKFRNI